MRQIPTHLGSAVLGLLALGALSVVGVVAAAPSNAPVPAADEQKNTIAPLTKNVRIAPHRAVYAIKLASVRNGSNISGVSGRLVFEWRDMCDGWAIQQHMQLHFSYTDSDDQDIVSAELTWEAKDGKRYNFNIRRMVDELEAESSRGKAVQNADGTVSVIYSLPQEKTIQLPKGTIFPSAHTQLLLRQSANPQAQDGKFFSRRVFDGSDDDGASDISAFILPQRADGSELNAELKKNPLLTAAAQPVHLAFFKTGEEETGVPDYEMDLDLLSNGVAQHMKIDYGDFSVFGELEEIKALEAQSCP